MFDDLPRSPQMAKKQVPRRKKKKRKKSLSFKLTRKDLIPLLIGLIPTLLVFLNTLSNGFVNWDDDLNIYENPMIEVLDWAHIREIFSSGIIGNYNPLPIFTFAIEKALFGLEPFVYHLNNLLLHLVCVFLVYRLSRMLGCSMYAAALIAVFFGVHPMRVESVAWATERKDVLFGAFYLGALIQYVKWYRKGFKRKYLVHTILLFVLALFSKIQAVSLPLSLLAIDYFLKRKIAWKLLLEKIPYFLGSLAFGILGILVLADYGSLDPDTGFAFWQRLFIGSYSYTVYIFKWVYPYMMSPLYPYLSILPWYIYASAAFMLPFVGFFFWAYKKELRPVVFGIAFFTFNVMFVLQILGAGQGFIADRFTYIPYFGLFFIIGYYWDQLRAKMPPKRFRGVNIGLAVYLLFLMFITVRQNKVWTNSGTLWTHVLEYYKRSPLPYRNRANFYRDQGNFDLAMVDYNASIAIKRDPDVINSRARLHFSNQEYQKAMDDYNEAIAADNTMGEYFINRGAVHAVFNNLDAAVADITRGIELDPDNDNGYRNRSLVYQKQRRFQEAHDDILTYLSMVPTDADLWYESGRLYNMRRDSQKAIEAINKAISINPTQGLYYFERSRALLALGQKSKAMTDLQAAKSRGVPVTAEMEREYQ